MNGENANSARKAASSKHVPHPKTLPATKSKTTTVAKTHDKGKTADAKTSKSAKTDKQGAEKNKAEAEKSKTATDKDKAKADQDKAKADAEKQKAAQKPPAEKTAQTADAKNNCPEKQVKVCDVTKYTMKMVPKKLDDASDNPAENEKSLTTTKQLRNTLSSKDIAALKKLGKGYVKLMQQYDLVIETVASYKTADAGPETTIDFVVETEWEGKCSVHPLLVAQPHTDTGAQDASITPTAQNNLAKFKNERFAWPVGTTSGTISGLTALGIIDDIVDAEEAGVFRTMLGIGGVVWALGKTVDIEIFADSEGVATANRKPNKHLNGLLRIYRDTEIGIELSVPFGQKVSQKKERGEATQARETEEPRNSSGARKWELKLKIGTFEILLDGDESQEDTVWKKGNEAADATQDYVNQRRASYQSGTLMNDIGQDINGVRGDMKTAAQGQIQGARDEWNELKTNAGNAKAKADAALTKSREAANKASQRYRSRTAADDAALGRAPKRYQKLLREIVRAWRMLNAAVRANGGFIKEFLNLLKKWPKCGWFFEFEYSVFSVTLSASLARMIRPGNPELDRLYPVIGNIKFAVEGVFLEAKGKIGFGVIFEFSTNTNVEVSLNAQGDVKIPAKIEASPFDDSCMELAGELNLKLQAVAHVQIGIFTFDIRAELASGIRVKGEIKWAAGDRKLSANYNARSIPVTLSGSFTEPGLGTVPEVGSIQLVPAKMFMEEKWEKVFE